MSNGATPTGEVEIKANNKKVCTANLSGGRASCPPTKQTALKLGSYSVIADYKGSKEFAASLSPAGSLTVEKEGSPPITTITMAPSGEAASGPVEIAFTSSQPDSTFECSLDGASYVPCSSPDRFTVSAGAHTFSVRAINAHGTEGPKSPNR